MHTPKIEVVCSNSTVIKSTVYGAQTFRKIKGNLNISDICGSAGIELTESGSCSPCEKGFYKVGQSDISCLPCPFGFTTLTTGATEVSMCSYGKQKLHIFVAIKYV